MQPLRSPELLPPARRDAGATGDGGVGGDSPPRGDGGGFRRDCGGGGDGRGGGSEGGGGATGAGDAGGDSPSRGDGAGFRRDGGGGGDGSGGRAEGGGGGLPAEAYAACLAALPGMGPARLMAVLALDDPAAAWARVGSGRGWGERQVREALGGGADRLVERWQRAARDISPAAMWQRVLDAGVGVATLGSPAYPSALADDVEPPAILFHLGSPEVITGPRVAIVGTRRCTATGTSVALELGRDLSRAGVAVVSGLATGIDAAAHRGALTAGAAPPIGVAGSGLDVVYPRGQAALWQAVVDTGVLLSETPLGIRPERWRFPARNRIIAALADLVVVIESHRRGGSLHTVDEADRRGVDVLAVPGSVRNPAAAGTNGLLAEGRAPVTCADDVLMALGLGSAGRHPPADRRPRPAPDDQALLDVLGWQAATLDQLLLRSERDLGAMTMSLHQLIQAGWVVQHGGWYERVAEGGS
ncbi:MAG TPA: DNA-processing protein DprA [Acidimicrobiales bacterium]|nr:DNA-processing protein DprA [Acidimicrobiales bacterium]